MANKLTQFLSESRAELKKVVWPKKDEVMKSTVVVVFVTLFISLFLFLTDQSVEYVMDLVWK